MDARRARGLQTKQRILDSAAVLFHQKGVNGTSVDDVLEASKTGKSQFYHFFGSKDRLVHDVLKHHMIRFQHMREALLKVESLEQFEEWSRMGHSEIMAEKEFYGCPVGMMANELSGTDEDLRLELEQGFIRWQEMFARCFAVLKAKGELVEAADPDGLAEFFVANFQGSCLLAKATADRSVMSRGISNSMVFLRTFASNK